jgi:hypothetical protein
MAALSTVAAVGLGISAASAGYQAYQSNKAQNEAEKQAKMEQQRIQKQKQTALKKRKTLINQQRRQLTGGASTNPTGAVGLPTTNINEGLLG